MENKELDLNKIRKIAMDGMYVLIVIAISIVYIFWGLLEVNESGKTIEQIIIDGFLTFIVGYSIGMLLSAQGYKNGWNNEQLIEAQKKHREKVQSINDRLDNLEAYLEERHEKKIKALRIQILSEEALSYKDFSEGKYAQYQTDKEFIKTHSKSQLRAIYKAYHCKPKKLKGTDLIKGGMSSSKNDDDELGDTVKEHQAKTQASALGYRIITAIVFGYYGIEMARNFNWITLIWTSIQVVIFLGSGFMRYDSAYSYMKENIKDRYYAQIDILTSFEAWEKKKEENQSGK